MRRVKSIVTVIIRSLLSSRRNSFISVI